MVKKVSLTAILSIVAGIVVIAFPQVLAWVVGLFLIINGILDIAKK